MPFTSPKSDKVVESAHFAGFAVFFVKLLIGWNKYGLRETHAKLLIRTWQSVSAIENGNHARYSIKPGISLRDNGKS